MSIFSLLVSLGAGREATSRELCLNRAPTTDNELICLFQLGQFCRKIQLVFHSVIEGIEKNMPIICTIHVFLQSLKN
jgi:hypothetical protein